MSQHRFLVSHAQLIADEPILDGDELRHLRVRRIQPDEVIVLMDGSGLERTAVVGAVQRDRVMLRCTGDLRAAPEPALRLTLAQAVLKADKLDLVVEKATEIGADSIVLFDSERVVAGLSEAKLARLRRLAQSAAKQAQAARVPEIRGPVSLSQLVDLSPDAAHVLFWEESAVPLKRLASSVADCRHLVVVVGPEGGFTRAEVEAARLGGCHVASLGTRILRAETAAIAALAICSYVFA